MITLSGFYCSCIYFLRPSSTNTFTLITQSLEWFNTFLARNCYEEDIYYNGENYINLVQNVLSAQDCQILCQEEPTCTQFGYNVNGYGCYLNSGAIVKTNYSGVVSGPKFCPSGENLPNLSSYSSYKKQKEVKFFWHAVNFQTSKIKVTNMYFYPLPFWNIKKKHFM